MPSDPKVATPDALAATHVSPSTPAASPAETGQTGQTSQSGAGLASMPPELLADRYELLGLVAIGGMGAVYRARDRELDEVVALKMLRRELLDTPDALARFRQEVKLARRVTHKNVARTYDIHDHDGLRFLTMELIDGESLTDLLQRAGPLPVSRVVAIGSDICAALAAAHAADVVHRDLKPDNVLLAKDGRAVITDFGIARALQGSAAAGLATMGMPIGTPAYMAPEQVEGGAVDARADIYAFGEILYEMLTGERAWQGESIYQLAAVRLLAPPPDARAKKQDVPTGAAQLALRCMAKEPAKRPATIREVAAALAGLTLPALEAPGGAPSAARREGLVPAALEVAAPTPATAKSVAVMPFRNIGAPEDDYLADGLTEDLIDTLSMSDGVRVRALGAVLHHKGKITDPREFGRELSVQVVVDGSVRKLGDRMRIAARLVSVADGFQLWARRFDRAAADFLKVGDEMADAIAGALTVERGRVSRDTPTDPLALDLYLRARHEYHKFWKDATERSVALFEQALARAPRDPVILSGYAMALMRVYVFGSDAVAVRDRALSAAEQALQIAPGLPEPHVALAGIRFIVGQPEEGARELVKALEAGKASPDAHDTLGRLLVEIGLPYEGIRHLELARSIEPRMYRSTFEIARVYELVGDSDRADELLANVPSDPSIASAYWLVLGRVLAWRGDRERARAFLAAAANGDGPTGPPRLVFQAAASETLDEEAYTTLTTLAAQSVQSTRRAAFFHQVTVETCAYHGDFERAFTALAGADRALLHDIEWIRRCPLLAPMRSDPRFAAIDASVGARAARIRAALKLT